MTINYTTLLGLAEPVTGTESGTWGDDVNKGITDYLDIAVAGTQTISGSQTAVTLSVTTGSSAGNNIAQVGSGSTGTAQYQIIKCTGNPAGLLTITAPASSKTYVVINATSTSQSVKLVGAGPTTGVTIVSGEKAFLVWDGSDFVKVATSTSGTGTVTAVSVTSANGFAGTSSGGATPALTLSTSITGVLKGNGTAMSAATAGTDYLAPPSGTAIQKANSGGALANAVAGVDYAAATTGTNAQLLANNGSGGFSNVVVGSGLSYSGGTLSASGSALNNSVRQTINSSTTTTIDLASGPVVALTMISNITTLTITASQTSQMCLLYVIGNGTSSYTITNPASIVSGVIEAPGANATNVYTLYTQDTGTTWEVTPAGQYANTGIGKAVYGWGYVSGYATNGGNFGQAVSVANNNLPSSTESVTAWGPNQNFVFEAPANQSNWSNFVGGSADSSRTWVIMSRTDGTLWSWGDNGSGQLGDGSTTTNTNYPARIGTLTNWTSKIAAGGLFTIAVKSDGTLWAWGVNGNGQLGDGTIVAKSSPVQIGTLTNWSKVACGPSTSFAVKTDGTLWTWGYGTQGQLGTGSTVAVSSPVQVGTLTTWASVSASLSTGYAVKTDGTLWSFGGGTAGQLGDGTAVSKSSPVQVGTLTTWTGVACANTSAYAKKNDGTLWAWGTGTSGQLGDGTSVNKSSPVQIGTLTTWQSLMTNRVRNTVWATKTDGTLWSWGTTPYNFQSVTPLQYNTNLSNPTQVSSDTDWYIPAMGTVSTYPASWSTVTAQTNLMLRGTSSGASLWSCSYSTASAALVMPTTMQTSIVSLFGNSKKFVSLSGVVDTGDTAGCALDADGKAWIWANPSGASVVSWLAGRGATLASFTLSSPIQVGSLLAPGASNYPSATNNIPKFKSVVSAALGFAAVGVDNKLYAWGSFTTPPAVGNNQLLAYTPSYMGVNSVSKFSLGYYTGFVITTSGTLYAAGSNANGAYGDGSTTDKSFWTQIGSLTNWSDISCNYATALAVKTDGTLWAWGANGSGSIGDGTVVNKSSPVQIGTLTNWSKVYAGPDSSSYAIKADGTLWAWGNNGQGQLGDGTSISKSSPVQIGTLTGWSVLPKNCGVAPAGANSLMAAAKGTDLYMWGPFGYNVSAYISSPVLIGSGVTWSDILPGVYRVYAV